MLIILILLKKRSVKEFSSNDLNLVTIYLQKVVKPLIYFEWTRKRRSRRCIQSFRVFSACQVQHARCTLSINLIRVINVGLQIPRRVKGAILQEQHTKTSLQREDAYLCYGTLVPRGQLDCPGQPVAPASRLQILLCGGTWRHRKTVQA